MNKIIRFRREVNQLLARWVKSPEYVYLVTALLSVVAFVFITPPFQGPDEEAHYIRTQYIAQGYFIPVNVAESSASLPSSIADTLQMTFYNDDLRGNSTNKYELYRTKEALNMPLNDGEKYKPPMVNYSPLTYLPAVPGVAIAQTFNLSPLLSMYIARLSLGIASVLLIFLAIRLIPHKKYLMAAVGLIPMLLFQQSVITADSVSYALLALFISFVLYLYEKKTITTRQWVLLALLCASIILAKPLLYLFLPLVFILVKKPMALRWIAGTGVVCVALLFAWLAVSSVKSEGMAISGMPQDVSSQEQLGIILSDPKRAARVAWNSYMTNHGDDEVRGVLGIFGAADTIYPLWMFVAYASVLGFLYVVNIDLRKQVKIHKGWKLFACILCIGYFTAVNLAIYLGYTPVNFDIVYGVQGRYFLPILIIAAAIIFTGGVRVMKTDIPRATTWTVWTLVVLVLLALFITFQRYYLFTP